MLLSTPAGDDSTFALSVKMKFPTFVATVIVGEVVQLPAGMQKSLVSKL
jgi:hypothetical protein